MKPVHLTVEGLNSFQSRVEIDFRALLREGLFGLFGDTGSGKSSVLDAITLALYGWVARAPRGTQGILNRHCDQMFVAFRFSLGSGGAQREYLVERAYGRNDKTEYGIELLRARLVRLDEKGGVDALIEDKGRFVSAAVEKLLGLTYEDFSRSIVLPQGAFSEFLQLGPKARRQMLERLFALDKYGEALTRRARRALDARKADAQMLAVQMGELGDVSKARGVALQKKLEELRKEIEAIQARLTGQEEGLSKLKARLALARGRDEWAAQLRAWTGRREEMRQMERALRLAEKARSVRPVYEGEQAARAANEEARAKLCRQAQGFEEAQALLEAARQGAERARLAYEGQQQTLPGQIARLEELVKVEAEYFKAEGEEAGLKRECGAHEARLLQLRARIAQIEASLLVADEYEKKQNEVYQAHAQALTQAGRAARGMALEGQLQRGQARLDAQAGEIEVLRAAAELAKNSLEVARLQHAQLSARHIKAQARYEQGLEQERAGLAARLAASLAAGEPCPVCGSTHHPLPAHAGQEAESAEPLRKALEALSAALSQSAVGEAQAASNAERAESSLDQARARGLELEREMQEIQGELSLLRTELGREDLTSWAKELEQSAELSAQAQKRLAKARERREELIREQRECLRQEGDCALLHGRALERQAALRAAKAQCAARLSDAGVFAPGAGEALLEGAVARARQRAAGQLAHARAQIELAGEALKRAGEDWQRAETALSLARGGQQLAENAHAQAAERLARALSEAGFALEGEMLTACLSAEQTTSYEQALQEDVRLGAALRERGQSFPEDLEDSGRLEQSARAQEGLCADIRENLSSLSERRGGLLQQIADYQSAAARHELLSGQYEKASRAQAVAEELCRALRGEALVSFVARETIYGIAADASGRLARFTAGRYGLVADGDAQFLVTDAWSGGEARPVSTLSGGETFMASLSLALALSVTIQVRGQPLGFFFLDEGFGTLDAATLETVMDALEALRNPDFSVGVISHVPLLRERIPARLILKKGEGGSRAALEFG